MQVDWSTVAFFAVAVVGVLGLLWLGVVVYGIRQHRKVAQKMDDDFEKRREERRRGFGR